MTRIRVLVVDTSAPMRRVIADTLGTEPTIDVVATVATGRIALQRLAEHPVDVVTVDVLTLESEHSDGLATVAEIRRRHRDLPIIMYSTPPPVGTQLTSGAIHRGASAFVQRPAMAEAMVTSLRQDLLPAIRRLGAVGAGRAGAAPLAPIPRHAPAPTLVPGPTLVRAPARRPDVVAIAASTGGPSALTQLFAALATPMPVPILITQHMPADFLPLLASRMQTISPLPVRIAEDGEVAEPGTAYLAPGDLHLRGRRCGAHLVLELGADPPVLFCRPAADPMISSLVDAYGAGVLAIILTGMGHDGVASAALVRKAGGEVIAQDQASSTVWGMPRAVIRAGHASAVLSLDQIADAINRRARGVAGSARIERQA